MTMTSLPPAAKQAAAIAAAAGRPARPLVGGVRVLTPVDGGPAPDSIEALLAAGEASVQQKLRNKAARIREQITELSGLLAVEAEAKQLEDRVKKLRTELSQAETELRTLRNPAGTPTPRSSATAQAQREITRAVRAWAKTNNIEVNAYGTVPQQLVEQWQNATGGIQ